MSSAYRRRWERVMRKGGTIPKKDNARECSNYHTIALISHTSKVMLKILHRGWDDWMASLTQWRWIWVDSGRWWWTRRPGMLWSMGLWRVGHYWATELREYVWLTKLGSLLSTWHVQEIQWISDTSVNEYLLCSRHSAWHFACFIPFNPLTII